MQEEMQEARVRPLYLFRRRAISAVSFRAVYRSVKSATLQSEGEGKEEELKNVSALIE
jgi:hypothetical protein